MSCIFIEKYLYKQWCFHDVCVSLVGTDYLFYKPSLLFEIMSRLNFTWS